MDVSSERVLRAVGRHLNWRSGTLIPEAHVRYDSAQIGWAGKPIQREYAADLMWVTDSLFAMEIEIKTSMSDWKADRAKGKWGRLPSWVSRFVYAVPAALGEPEWVPEWAGIWHIFYSDSARSDIVRVVRVPKRIGKDRVPKKTVDHWIGNLYYRYWNNRLHEDRRLGDHVMRVAKLG